MNAVDTANLAFAWRWAQRSMLHACAVVVCIANKLVVNKEAWWEAKCER